MLRILAASFSLNACRPARQVKRLTLNAIVFIFFFSLFTITFPLLADQPLVGTFTRPVHAQDIFTTGKLITVDIGKQKVFAWEGGKVVFETKASTGMRYTPTVKGDFSIYRKVPAQDMKGNYPPYPKYHLKNVPNVMYFYQAYAIHGAYWHNKFGLRVTHGCVNVPVAASQWLFNWADVGTRVAVF